MLFLADPHLWLPIMQRYRFRHFTLKACSLESLSELGHSMRVIGTADRMLDICLKSAFGVTEAMPKVVHLQSIYA